MSDVADKARLIANIFSKNYKQREAVAGMAEFYTSLLKNNTQAELSSLFFVTGSPRQLNESINNFLDYQHFPARILISKKLHGDNSDPLFDQFSYKVEKIKTLFEMFPKISFILVGDDGEKDPEVYAEINKLYPGRVIQTWIRKVSQDPQRATYADQRYFVNAPTN